VLVRDAISRKEALVLFVRCDVRYSGRAESYLEQGDRVILIKPDGVILIHQPEGNAPVNYMKPGAVISAFVEDGMFMLKCEHLQQKEYMDVIIHRIYAFNSHKLEDGQRIILQGNEADMAKMLYQDPQQIEQGFRPVSQEEQTRYGFVDVLGVDKNDVLTVVECKR